MEAMLLAADELGYERATVRDALKRARTSRATFYEHFADKEDCFRRAYEQVADWVSGQLVSSAEMGAGGRERLRLAMVEAVSLSERHPAMARALLVSPHVAQGRVLEAHNRFCNRLAEELDRLRCDAPTPQVPPEEAAAFTVGAVETLLRGRLASDPEARVRDLLPRLLFVATAQFFGMEAAWEEMGITSTDRDPIERDS